MKFIFTYHPAWLLVITIIALVYAGGLYFRNQKLYDLSKRLKIILFSTRFLSIFIICLLLLGIINENQISKNEKPLIFVAQDDSQSIRQTKDSTFYFNEYPKLLNESILKLQEKYEVISYSFSTNLTNGITSTYSGETTDISKVFNQIYNQYTNRNIGAIVLASDGIYNQGTNPLYVVNTKNYIPVYTIGMGDTTEKKDVKIVEIYNNDIAFLNNTFPVEIRLEQNDFPNREVTVSILDGDKTVASQPLKFSKKKEQQTLNFNLDANKIGFRKYTVQVSTLEGEFTYENNLANFYIDIIDGRQKIALVYSGVHPDLNAIHYVVDKNKNYEIELIESTKFDGADQYDLVICHNYQNNNQKLNDLLTQGKKPALYIVGPNSNLADLNKIGIGFSGNGKKSEDVNFTVNGKFNSIVYPPELTQLLSKAPPLKAPFGNFSYSNSLDVFAYQKVGNIDLNTPLIYFSQKNNTKLGVIMGEGIWRWRLYDQAQNGATDNFETFISKIITYLAIKENKNPFKVHLKNEYTESEKVIVTAELYNSSFELVNNPDVEFILTNSDDQQFNYQFFKTSNAYKLELGKLPQGIYNWTAKTTLSNKNYTNSGTFLVKEIKLEWLTNKADHRLLKNLSENTNAQFYLPQQLETLTQDILTREDIVTVSYQEKSFDDLIDYKWLFFMIVALLFFEWFVRKYFGV
ncbi:MAG: hypothetical protein ACWA41_04795 [Putridiphycobacter sp.]